MAVSGVREVAVAFVALGLVGIVWVLLVGGSLLYVLAIVVEVIASIAAYVFDAEDR